MVVTAHAFVAGDAPVREADSERDISVGGTSLVSTAVFDGAHYVALGHLHRAQQPVPGRIAYSGAPLAYSFSEVGRQPSVTVAELGADGSVQLEQLDCPVERPLGRLEGTLESLLSEARWSGFEHHLLAVTLTDAHVPLDPIERLRRRFPGVLQLSVAAHRPDDARSYTSRLEGLDDIGLVTRFAADAWGRPLGERELAQVRAGFEAQRIAEVSA